MRKGFAQGVANVRAFTAGITRASKRGAQEAGIVHVEGEPGFGKSHTLRWWAAEREDVIYIRAKAAYTPNWFLSDLCDELTTRARHRSRDLFTESVEKLMERQLRSGVTLIVDEIDHCLHDERVIHTIRDITDTVECLSIFAGTPKARGPLNKDKQLSSRIAARVIFGPATRQCVRVVCDALCEVKVADDLVAHIHAETGGRMREVMNAVAAVEQIGKRASSSGGGRQVALADIKSGTPLTNDAAAGRLELVQGEASAAGAR